MQDSRIATQRLLILTISSALISSGLSLQSPDNVCGTRLENYTLPLRETYKEPVIVHTFTWCLKVPPRCPKTRIEIRERFRLKTIVKQRTVTECCEGYVLQESEEADIESYPRCVPSCSKSTCKNGICVTPNSCLCDPDFRGDDCSESDLSSERSETISSSHLGTTEPDVGISKSRIPGSIGSQDPISRTTEEFEEKQNLATTTRIEYPTTRTNPMNPEFTPFDEIVEVGSDKTGSENTEFTESELDYRNYVNEESRNPVRGTELPQRSYVKTVQKGNDSNQIITNDMTVLIIVGTIVSLCLTTLAALTVFYLRCKILDSIPISIYSDGTEDNDKNDERRTDTLKSLKITSTTLPPLPTFVNPVFPGSQETALITFDAAELNKHYDKGTATISIRVSGNIRDLLESHYDRPPTATCRHNVDQNTEHVYDEIPLTATTLRT